MNSCDKKKQDHGCKVRLGIIEGVYNAKSGHQAVPSADSLSPISLSKGTLTRRTRRIRTETVLSFQNTAHRVFTLHWHSAAISLWMS